jgi:hypothetical protein
MATLVFARYYVFRSYTNSLIVTVVEGVVITKICHFCGRGSKTQY